jgi:RimJ/RimL family protein N-acetyltransferase
MLDPAPSQPSGSATSVILANGAEVCVRPIRATDRAPLAAAFARLSAHSRARRFLGPKPSLTDRELTYLTDVDHVAHEALVATTVDGEELVGVARYATWPDSDGAADLAVTVADDLQGHGLGGALARRIVARARANGLPTLVATTSWENSAARALVRALGFRGRGSSGAVIDFELPLGPAPGPVATEAAGWPPRPQSNPPA